MTGILAVGDSLLDTPGSWAWRLSEATDRPLTTVAVAGSRITDVLAGQLPGLGLADGYWCACLSVGVNDVRDPDWSLEGFMSDLDDVVGELAKVTSHVLMPTLSLGLCQRPGFAWADRRMRVLVEGLNDALGRRTDVVAVPAGDLRTYRYLKPDLLHFTDAAQAKLADRAARLLGVEVVPSELHPAQPSMGRRAWVTYAVRRRDPDRARG